MDAPRAKKVPKEFVEHGRSRTDDYYWLRERENPEVIAHLEAENAYADALLADTAELQEQLFQEMKGRIKEDDMSAPYKYGDYFYYSRVEAGKQYAILCRKEGSLDAPEEVLLDENALAEGHEFLSVAFAEVSPDHRLLAYAVDHLGNERHHLYMKDLSTGALLPDEIQDVDYALAWANDSKTFFYTVSDETRRPYQVKKHVLGTDAAQDSLVFEEPDERFFVGVGKTRSDRYVLIELESKLTTEAHAIDADDPDASPRCLNPRRQGHEYHVDHRGDEFLFVTNKDALNFRLMAAPVETPDEAHWVERIPHRPDVLLEGIDCFEGFVVVHELEAATPKLRILRGEEDTYVSMPAAVYALEGAANAEYRTGTYRFAYSSLATPHTVYELDVATQALTVVKKQEVLGGFDESQYAVERVFATAPDGVRVPISLAYRKDAKTGENPVWLHGYGSYGSISDPEFSTIRVSLLDRGFVFALAHIRGGGEGGRQWYEDGKFLKKMNTFTDFIACAEYLLGNGYGAKDKLVVSGRSAGGLLMGAVANLRPDLVRALVTEVPFVDVINTMMDPTIPLTVTEYEEWGDPNDPVYYEYMHSYAPYEHVEAKEYPHMFVAAGLNDTRVQYWEPAKWVAKLRDLKTDENLLLLKTNMDAGHGGASGRYDVLKEKAREYAFALKALGMA